MLSVRERLPKKRRKTTYDVDMLTSNGRIKIHLHCELYEDGRLGGVSIDHAKTGATIRSMFKVWSRTASIALQNGAALSELTNTLLGTQDPTAGILRLEQIPDLDQTKCESVWDAIAKILCHEYAA